jgi:NAD+ diphosphatase
MLGFRAEYDSGEINIDPIEIEAADWFSKENMPKALPNRASIARSLIDGFLND